MHARFILLELTFKLTEETIELGRRKELYTLIP